MIRIKLFRTKGIFSLVISRSKVIRHFFTSLANLKLKQKQYLSLGVSICLNVISIEISISTPKKYQSRRSRKSRRFSKVSLDVMDNLGRDRDFSIWSRHHHPDPNISIEIEIYRDLSRFTKKSR